MAVYVLLIKEYEDDEKVVYKYGHSEDTTGKIEYNKISRAFKEIESIKKKEFQTTFSLTLQLKELRELLEEKKEYFLKEQQLNHKITA